MRAAALLTDRLLRKLGGPFDRATRADVEEVLDAAMEDCKATVRLRAAALCDRKALLNLDKPAVRYALEAAARDIRKG